MATFIVLLVVVLGSVVLNKGSLAIAASMLRPMPSSEAEPHVDLECRDYVEVFNETTVVEEGNTTTTNYDVRYDNFTK